MAVNRMCKVWMVFKMARELIRKATLEDMPINALDEFIEARIELIIDELRKLLEGIEFDVIDTKNLDK